MLKDDNDVDDGSYLTGLSGGPQYGLKESGAFRRLFRWGCRALAAAGGKISGIVVCN